MRGIMRSSRNRLSEHLAKSRTACHRDRYFASGAVFRDGRFATGGATQSGARTCLLRSPDSLRDRGKSDCETGPPKLAILPSPQALTETAWQALLEYVDDGGNLLITGSVDRDEHWRIVGRAANLKVDAGRLSHSCFTMRRECRRPQHSCLV